MPLYLSGARVRITKGKHVGRPGAIATPTVGTWPDANGMVGITLDKYGNNKVARLLFMPSQFILT